MTARPTSVIFASRGITCAADLYRPHNVAHALPCVVIGHGFSGTKGLAQIYAERFAGAGLAALAFDYRHFGASDGQPRQLVDVAGQRSDYHAAVAFARNHPDFDPKRIALWGTSLSGGHVISVAAADPDIWAVVSQVPLLDAGRTGRTRRQRLQRALTRSALKLFVAAGRDAAHALLDRPPYLARVVGVPGYAAVFTEPEAHAAFAALGGEAAGWCNAFAPRFLYGLPRYRAGTAERVSMPLLVCIADDDREASAEFVAQVAARAPRGEIRHYAAGHFDVYLGPIREQMIADQIAFLRSHL